MEILSQCPGSANCGSCNHMMVHRERGSCFNPCGRNPSCKCVRICPDRCANKDVNCEDCYQLSCFKQKDKGIP
jgi:hypothetical protein